VHGIWLQVIVLKPRLISITNLSDCYVLGIVLK